MNALERGFLLLTSHLGNPDRKPMTVPQLRTLADRIRQMPKPMEDRDLQRQDLLALGYNREMAERIYCLLQEEDALDHYLHRANRVGCIPVTRVSDGYPLILRQRLGLDSPGCLWVRGDKNLLTNPAIALVGSRDLQEPNRAFAQEVGRQAAQQGLVLVSGNARGADKIAQEACLAAGGKVICVVADELQLCRGTENVLFVSEEGFDLPFTPQRALSRNRVIHALAEKTMVAQCTMGKGGTWDGTVKNLRHGWSSVYCFGDGSAAMTELEQQGAHLIGMEALADLKDLPVDRSLFD